MSRDVTRAELSPRQRRFVAELLGCATIQAAAATVGVTPRTAARWMRNDRIREALQELQTEAMAAAARRLVAGMSAAIATLETIHGNPKERAPARVAAARAILDAGLKLAELVDLAQRVAALEQQLGLVSGSGRLEG